MMYVTGFNFIVGHNSSGLRSGSLQQQMTQNRLSDSAAKNTSFQQGNSYTLYYISPFTKDNKRMFKYLFINDSTREKITLEFNNSAEADNYIARISGKTEELSTIRNQIITAGESAL